MRSDSEQVLETIGSNLMVEKTT